MVDGWVLDSIGILVFQYIFRFAIGFHQSQRFPNNSVFFQLNIGGHRINDLDLTLLFTTIVRGHVWQSWLLEMDDAQIIFNYIFCSWWCCFKSFETSETTKEKAGRQSCGCIRAVMSLSLCKSPRRQAWLFTGWSSQRMNLKMEVQLDHSCALFFYFYLVRVHSWGLEAAWVGHQDSARTVYISEIITIISNVPNHNSTRCW